MNRPSFVLAALLASAAVAFYGCSDSDGPSGVRPGDDTTPPSPVSDATLALVPGTDEVRIEWTAPRDDSLSERVSAYDIRTTYTEGYALQDFWSVALPVPNPPVPGAPGTPERYTIANPARARDLWVGILSIDEAGNRSLPGEPVTIHVPGYTFAASCRDVFAGLPVEGLDVTLSTGPQYHYTTDAAGGFVHARELDGGVTYVEIRNGSAATAYHPLSQPFVLEGDSVHAFVMIPVERVNAPWVPNLLSLFKGLVNFRQVGSLLTAGDPLPISPASAQVLAKWHHRPVPCYIPAFVNTNGVDYGEQARLAATRWMDRTGEPLFAFVSSAPDTGIIVTYKTRSEMGGGVAVTRFTLGADAHPIKNDIWIVDEAADAFAVYKVFLHEFGHTISLGHTDDPTFIMFIGQPVPDDISDDEVRVVQLHESLPTRIDMSIYDEGSP